MVLGQSDCRTVTWRRARVAVVFFLLAYCASTLAFAERLPLKFYTTADGLPHNAVNRIVRDSRGFLWFCTADGLSRFDGYSFTNFGVDQGLPNANVTDLLETRDRQYWVATAGGLARFDPEKRPVSVRSSVRGAAAPQPLSFTIVAFGDTSPRSHSVTVLRQDRNGTIWCGTEMGLFRLTAEGAHPMMLAVDIGIPRDYPEQATVTDILEDDDGSLWIGTFSGLYRRWPDGHSVRLTVRDGLPDNIIHSLLRDHLGRLWAGTRRGGFFQFAAGDTRSPVVVLRHYNLRELQPTSWVFQLLETSDHRFWLATNRGLIEFFPDALPGHQFSAYGTEQGLSYREITALSEDSSGNLWLGTNTAGLMKLARNGFVTYGQADGLISANSIFEDQSGAICVRGATVRGDNKNDTKPYFYFARFDGERFVGFDLAGILPHPGWVQEHDAVKARNGEWWIGSGDGVSRFAAARNFGDVAAARPIAKYTPRNGLPGAQAFRIFEDSCGNIWVSTLDAVGNGFARWERATGKWTNLADVPGLPTLTQDLPRSFAEDRQGHVWIGFNGVLARYANEHFVWFGSNDGLPPGLISNLLVDHAGRLWVASSRSGLIRIDDTNAEHPVFKSYTTTQGISSNRIEVLTEDLYGRLYMGTGRGLDRLDPETGRVKHFTTADGLASGLFRAAFRDRSGALWFGMTGGISKVVPAGDEIAPAPPILLSGVTVAGLNRVFPFGERTLALPNLSSDQNRVQIDFVGLDFTPGEILRYQYRLQDGEWSAPNQQRAVSLAGLAPGHYRFQVRAINSNEIASTAPATVVFTVLAPIWQRWWFLLLVAMCVAAAAWAAYRYRMAQVLAIANLRTRIATDLHDDIGSNLTKIAILSEVARQQHGRDETASDGDSLSAIARISRESVSSMSDIVWAINPQRDHLLDLVRRMRQHAEQVFTTRGIRLAFRAPSEEQDIRLRADIRRDVFLIFKEAVNNAARHARCSEVEIEFGIADGRISLSVSDNGAGFDPTQMSNGEGLASMRRRAERLGGACEVRSEKGKNTIVHVTIATSAAAHLRE